MKQTSTLLFLLISQIGISTAQTTEFGWVHTHGDTLDDVGSAITTDSQNNIYISGYYTGDVDFDPGAGVTTLSSGSSGSAFIQKLNASGNLVWAKSFPTGGFAGIASMATDQSGNIILSGSFSGNMTFQTNSGPQVLSSPGFTDAFIAKMDVSGNFIWVKSFGGSQDDNIFEVQLDDQGNIYSTGSFYGPCDFDPGAGTDNISSASGTMDIFVQKLTAAGDYVWTKKFGGSGFDRGLAMAVRGNTIAITGWFQYTVDFDPSAAINNKHSLGSGDIFLLSLSTEGNFNWVKSFGSTLGDKGTGVAIANNGAIYLTGTFSEEIDLDPGAGSSIFTPSAPGENFFILQLSASADLNWAKGFTNGTSWKASEALALHPTNGIIVAAGFSETCDFDPGSGVSNLTAVGAGDPVLVYLDQNGNYIWAGSYGNNNPNPLVGDFAADICIDNTGNVYTTGNFFETVDFDCGTGVTEATSDGSFDVYVLKINSNLLSVDENTLRDFTLYPNPANDHINISAESLNDCSALVYSSLGTLVLEKELSDTDNKLDIQNLSPGSYIIQLTNASGSKHQTFVKID